MIKEVYDTLKKSLPISQVGHLRYRGLSIPLDPWMRGTTRFAYKFGGQGSVWKPDTTVVLTTEGKKNTSQLYINRVWKDLILNSIVSYSFLRNRITDWDSSDPSEISLSLETSLTVDLLNGSKLFLWGFPVEFEGYGIAGNTSVVVSTPLNLAVGDSLEIPLTVDISYQSTVSYKITDIDFLEDDPLEGLKYVLTLDKGLSRNVDPNEECFIRCYPAYFSGDLAVPTFGSNLSVVGPFLLDYLSGPLVKGIDFEEFLSVIQKKADGSVLTPCHTGSSAHNYQINYVPIRADQFLFWKMVEGKIQWDGNDIIAYLNADGNWRLLEKMGPLMELAGSNAVGAIHPSLAILNNETLSVQDQSLTFPFEFETVVLGFTPTPGKSIINLSTLTTKIEICNALVKVINGAFFSEGDVDLSLVVDNLIFTVFDGVVEITFETKKTGGFVQSVAGSTVVDLSAAGTDAVAATLLCSSINSILTGITSFTGSLGSFFLINSGLAGVGSGYVASSNVAVSFSSFEKLSIAASRFGEIVQLANKVKGSGGNLLVTSTVVDTDFVVSGMSNGDGGLSWIVDVDSDGVCQMIVGLRPNADQIFNLVSGNNIVTINFLPSDLDVEMIDIRFAADTSVVGYATQVNFGSWELIGSRTSVINVSQVIRVENPEFACSFLFAKPLWPSLDLLKIDSQNNLLNEFSLII